MEAFKIKFRGEISKVTLFPRVSPDRVLLKALRGFIGEVYGCACLRQQETCCARLSSVSASAKGCYTGAMTSKTLLMFPSVNGWCFVDQQAANGVCSSAAWLAAAELPGLTSVMD